jgi:hypothetical protein
MTTFDDRERAFESKFAHDAEMQFRAEARAVMMLSLWAGHALGMSGDETVAHSKALIADWIATGGKDPVFGRIAKEMTDSGAATEPAAVAAKFAECLTRAKAELHDSDAD